MGELRLLCLLVIPLLLFERIDGQAAKTPGDWSILIASQYPNPMANDTRCKTPAPVRVCDPNDVLTPSQRDDFNHILIDIENRKLLEKLGYPRSTIIVFAVMKNIGPDVHDRSKEADDLAKKFRELWNLDDCSVVAVLSNDSRTFRVDLGTTLIRNLTLNASIVENYCRFDGTPEAVLQCAGVKFNEALNKLEADRNLATSTTQAKNGSILVAVAVVVAVAHLCNLATF